MLKEAYLTIDDGPNKYRKERVDVLKKYGIQAIWFSVGRAIERSKEAALYTIANGGIIGNHSYSHANFSTLTIDQCQEEITKTDEIIEALYAEAGVKRPMKVFRFPFGNKGVQREFYDFNYTDEQRERILAIQSILKELGYVTYDFKDITYDYFKALKDQHHLDWYWTYDAMEWCVFQENPPFGVKTLEDVIELMDIDMPERWMGLNTPGSNEIVVIHDHDQTLACFEPVIARLLEKGIKFKHYTNPTL